MSAAFPLPDRDYAPLAPLWEGASRREFCLPRCIACLHLNWYPAEVCRFCDSAEIAWERLSGEALLFSWSIVHRALHKPLSPLGPYISAIVIVAEDPAARFVTRLVEAAPTRLRADMPLIVRFEDAGWPAFETGQVVPLFTPANSEDRLL